MSTVDNPRERLEFLQGTLEVLILRSLQAAPNHAYGISLFLEQQSGNDLAHYRRLAEPANDPMQQTADR